MGRQFSMNLSGLHVLSAELLTADVVLNYVFRGVYIEIISTTGAKSMHTCCQLRFRFLKLRVSLLWNTTHYVLRYHLALLVSPYRNEDSENRNEISAILQ